MILSDKGTVLLEGILILPLFFLALVFQVELARRGAVEVMVHYGAFWEARSAALGKGGNPGRPPSWRYLPLSPQVRLDRERVGKRCVGRAFLRFPTLVSFPLGDTRRHHFEVTRPCSFPLSSQ